MTDKREDKYRQCKKNETQSWVQKLFSVPLPSAGCEMVWRFLEVLFHVPHSSCRSKEPFPATYKPSKVGKINHVLGLLFSKENKWPNPVHTVTTELSTSTGVRLEACAEGGDEDLACTAAFAKGQDNLTQGTTLLVLFWSFFLSFLRTFALFWKWYSAMCEKWEQASPKGKSAMHRLQA